MKRAYLFSTSPISNDLSDRTFYVYVLFDWRGIPRYVGKGKRARWNYHGKGYDKDNHVKSKFIAETLAKIGEIPRLKIRDKLSDQEAREVEMAIIAAIGRYPYGPLTNFTNGGDGVAGLIKSESAKQAVSRAQKGTPETEEGKANIRLAAQQPERIAKIRAALTGRKQSPEHREKNRLKSLGTKLSPETRQKMSEMRRGDKHPMFGKHHTPESRTKISASKKGSVAWNKGKRKVRRAHL